MRMHVYYNMREIYLPIICYAALIQSCKYYVLIPAKRMSFCLIPIESGGKN